MLRLRFCVAAVVTAIIWPFAACAQSDKAGPTTTAPSARKLNVAVYIGAAPGNRNAAEALQDSLTQLLANTGRFAVVDRAHMQQVLQEQGLSASGQVQPTTEAQLGRMLGVSYIMTGKIANFTVTTENRDFLSGFIVGNTARYAVRLDLSSSIQLIDVSSGQILQSLDDTQTKTSPPVNGSPYGNEAQTYASSQYRSLAAASAVSLMNQLDLSRLVPSSVQPAAELLGRVLDVSAGQIILSLGSDSGIRVGTILGLYDVKKLRNPDTGNLITTYLRRGSVQVVQVEKDYAVAKRLGGGTATKLMVVRSEQP